VEKDDLQAFMWIDRSANLGDDKAKRARETMQTNFEISGHIPHINVN